MGNLCYNLGFGLLGLAAAVGIAELVIFSIRSSHLKRILEKEYGPKRH